MVSKPWVIPSGLSVPPFPPMRINPWSSGNQMLPPRYHQMPMHPLWQIKQAICIDDQFSIDRCNNFGGRASQKIWWSFISLVLWIAVFSAICAHSSVMLTTTSLLLSQVTLNSMLNMRLSCHPSRSASSNCGMKSTCHTKNRSRSAELPFHHWFDVDPNEMTVTMSEAKKSELITACTAFTVRGARKTLREFQRLQGWVNWSLNVSPIFGLPFANPTKIFPAKASLTCPFVSTTP
jgi:hypothetical protein